MVQKKSRLKRDLTFFDLTAIVIGSVVGSDIYIASAISAGLIGPFSIVIWALAGGAAALLALVFAYCSFYAPRVGGSFAFVSTAFDDFYGFLAGWSMWIAEIISLPVFAITFTNYLQFFFPLSFAQQVAVKAAFLFGLTGLNILGVKFAGRLNDALTLLKLTPLFLLIIVGLATFATNPSLLGNYSPLIPLGLGNFSTALVLIFWAYVGFEMGTLPASEVREPKKTIPKAIITGMAIVAAFYMLTNFIIDGTLNWTVLAGSKTPLVLVGVALLGPIGAIIMSLGALVSVSGSDESGILGTARLSYAMSIDGLFPKIFSKVHPKYKTPHSALVIQCTLAFLLSIFSGLGNLISFAVFNLAFSFFLTCMALVILQKDKEKELHGQHIIPWIGMAICLYLLLSTSPFDKLVGSALILIGIPIYIFFSPKQDINHLQRMFVSEEAIIERRMERKEKFLANLVRFVHYVIRQINGVD
jgi:basic amino acid/polyamine antiporter, APA family